MSDKSWSHLWHCPGLNLNFFQAYHAVHAYPRHSHDYYVVALVDKGLQSFTFAGTKHFTPVNGLILLNPGDVHTGEPVGEDGFGFCAFYPTFQHMETILHELESAGSKLPDFAVPRADDPQLARSFRSLHQAFRQDASPLECESKFTWLLVELIKRYGDKKLNAQKVGQEHQAVRKICQYIEENYARSLSLSELAAQVDFSRYYLLHLFRNETGMPPHAYQETLRIRQAQKLLAQGEPLVQIAHQTGFGSQSHFTQRFRRVVGVTPGEYARETNK